MNRRPILLIIFVVLLLRLPFLNQAIQGDDPYYIFGAQHALIDPGHPSHARYIFQGEMVDMRGHPHPPLNLWILAALLAIYGDVYEAPFHAAYIVFSLIAAVSMWFIAKRYTDHPLAATMLFVAAPAFVINGNSLESDLPFLAFWMLGFALFVSDKPLWAVLPLSLAAMTAYQAVVATPILAVYCWMNFRRSKIAWAAAATPVLIVGLYQAYERLTGGELPATVLAGYFSSYGLQQLSKKVRSALALTAHMGWIVFPLATAIAFRHRWLIAILAAIGGLFIDVNPLFWASFAIGAMTIAWCVQKPTFLTAWILLFFLAALVLFFAGSARYLLPLAAPLAILVSRESKLVPLAFAANLGLGLALAIVNYQHWDGYRKFTKSILRQVAEKRVWINGEWGMRFYLESAGALPLARDTIVQAGEWIVTSALGYPQPVTAPLARISEHEIRSTLPLRLVGLGSKSGYSDATMGVRPFDVGRDPIDRIRVEAVLERRPSLSYLSMNSPEAPNQIVNGIYALEDQWRWMSDRAVVLLKPPEAPRPLHIKLFVPEPAAARHIKVLVDGTLLHEQNLAAGANTIITAPSQGASITLVLDKTFSVPGDSRRLGAILSEVGFATEAP